VSDVLRERGVHVPITVIPTGIDTEAFASGDGARARQRHGIPADVFVVGHVGRLVVEKNLAFLARAVSRFLQHEPRAHFFVVGNGPMRDEIPAICAAAGVADRLHLSEGELEGQDLADAYAAMDVMAFSSVSETQGMVLAEGMAAGLPVVALDAPGARDIVRDRANGRLLAAQNEDDFAAALRWVQSTGVRDERLQRAVEQTAADFSMDRSVVDLETIYRAASRSPSRDARDGGTMQTVLQRMGEEYQIWARIGHALYDAAFGVSEPAQHKQAS
jgi:glycosyltransferase involved in cell wall biosynthesis